MDLEDLPERETLEMVFMDISVLQLVLSVILVLEWDNFAKIDYICYVRLSGFIY